jgi:hypothetical protein
MLGDYMLVHIHKASDLYFNKLMEITTLEDLQKIQCKYNSHLIIDLISDYSNISYPYIMIYDEKIED